MADALMGLLPAEANPGNILEAGCGTGRLTSRLRARFPKGNMLVTDAAPNMLAAARAALGGTGLPGGGRVEWALFDAEGLSPAPEAVIAGAPFDLAAGNALVQWFPDLERHFRLIGALLARSGTYLVSGFREDNFPELNAILREEPFGYAHFPGHGRDAVRRAAAEAGLEMPRWEEESIESPYASPREFLQMIRGLGSSRRPEEGRPLTRAKLEHLEKAYRERYALEGGVRATWRPWYARLRKP
jgi:malonyl-CoA O-methyltransferase